MTTNKEKYNKKYKHPKGEGHSLQEISRDTGIKKSILQQVYNRGVGAHKSNPQSVRMKTGKKNPSAPMSQKMSKEQWGQARVYSFVMGGTTQKTTDADLWKSRF